MQRDTPVLWVAGRYQPVSTSINIYQLLADINRLFTSWSGFFREQRGSLGIRDF